MFNDNILVKIRNKEQFDQNLHRIKVKLFTYLLFFLFKYIGIHLSGGLR